MSGTKTMDLVESAAARERAMREAARLEAKRVLADRLSSLERRVASVRQSFPMYAWVVPQSVDVVSQGARVATDLEAMRGASDKLEREQAQLEQHAVAATQMVALDRALRASTAAARGTAQSLDAGGAAIERIAAAMEYDGVPKGPGDGARMRDVAVAAAELAVVSGVLAARLDAFHPEDVHNREALVASIARCATLGDLESVSRRAPATGSPRTEQDRQFAMNVIGFVERCRAAGLALPRETEQVLTALHAIPAELDPAVIAATVNRARAELQIEVLQQNLAVRRRAGMRSLQTISASPQWRMSLDEWRPAFSAEVDAAERALRDERWSDARSTLEEIDAFLMARAVRRLDVATEGARAAGYTVDVHERRGRMLFRRVLDTNGELVQLRDEAPRWWEVDTDDDLMQVVGPTGWTAEQCALHAMREWSRQLALQGVNVVLRADTGQVVPLDAGPVRSQPEPVRATKGVDQ